MIAKMTALAMGWIAVLSGCVSPPTTSRTTIAPAVIISSHVDPESGDLIALWMPERGQKLRPILVPHPYAMYILWPSEEHEPNAANKRVFIFYDNVTKKSYQTKDYDAFLNVIRRQPRNITLLRCETCTVPRCYMPGKEWKKLEKALAEGNRRWATNPVTEDNTFGFCYCEAVGEFIYPGDKR